MYCFSALRPEWEQTFVEPAEFAWRCFRQRPEVIEWISMQWNCTTERVEPATTEFGQHDSDINKPIYGTQLPTNIAMSVSVHQHYFIVAV
jgi:hypothetical protein